MGLWLFVCSSIPPAASLQQDRRHGVPVKTFYFGMEHGEHEAVDRFAASLQVPPAPCSLSSDEPDEETGGSIALQLRPTLPKKQLEIPRFSPTAAWRLLSALEAHQPGHASPAHGEEGSIFVEECIQRLSRPVAPLPPQQVCSVEVWMHRPGVVRPGVSSAFWWMMNSSIIKCTALHIQQFDLTHWHTQTPVMRSEPLMSFLLILAFCQ